MQLPTNYASLLKKIFHITLAVTICWGFILVLAQIKPFWMDEWRVLYNLKFKNASALFGPLAFTQQFPRVYLVLIKFFSSPFDYSYFTLRLPAFLCGVGSILLGYRLMNKIYGTNLPERFLFVLIIAASPAFLKYFVQIKQYEMEIFLSLVAIWQLLALNTISRKDRFSNGKYFILCLSFFCAPFFSYTYPIVVAPLFLISFIQNIQMLRNDRLTSLEKRKTFARVSVPLMLSVSGILLFYAIDVSQVLKDAGMSCYWQENMIHGSSHPLFSFFRNIWGFFGTPGSGAVFIVLYSAVGLAAFFVAVKKTIRSLFAIDKSANELVVMYAVAAVLVVVILFIAGKLPLGEARLNAFALPAFAVLIIHLIQHLRSIKLRKLSIVLSALFFVGLSGNIFNTIVKTFLNDDYARSIVIYSHTEDMIIYAQEHHLPIVITPDVAYPDNIVKDIPCLEPIDAACVLKTFPAYKERYNVPVFCVVGDDELRLPEGIETGIVGDGLHYKVIKK